MKVCPRALAPALLLLLLAGCRSAERLRPDVPPLALEPPLRKQVLEGWMPLHNVAWVDNERVMFEGSPTAKDVPPEAMSLWLWDRKGPPRRLLASTAGACSTGGRIDVSLLTAPGEPRRRFRLHPPDFRPVPLQTPPLAGPSVAEPISCTRLPLPERLRNRSWRALRRGDGYLDFGPLEGPRTANQPVLHWDAALQQARDTGIRFDGPILAKVDYAAHDGSYLVYDFNLSPEEKSKWLAGGQMRIWRLDRDFRGEAIDVPSGPWVDQDVSFSYQHGGILIESMDFQRNGNPGGAGAYLLTRKKGVERLERGLVEYSDVSDNGCHLAYAYRPRLDTILAEGGPRLVAVDLC